MDKGKRALGAIFWGICLFVLILDTKTVISGAADGIDLCIRVLIPSIFPFLVICSMVTASMPGSTVLLRPIGRLLRLPKGAEDLFFLGLLSGYPVGAAMVSQAVQGKRISHREGQRLVAFCSNAGPSFIFGMGAGLFPGIGYCALLWLIQILSAAAVGMMTPGRSNTANTKSKDKPSLQQALRSSLMTMATICGWVVLLRILITVLERWALWFLPSQGQIILRGILELANGIVSLAGIGSLGQRMILFSMLLSFGGLCVWLQTLSVCQGVSTRYYLPGKVTQSAISVLLTAALQFFLPAEQRYYPKPIFLMICVGICVVYPIFLRKIEKRSRNSALVGV